jgi:hypothetical protein
MMSFIERYVSAITIACRHDLLLRAAHWMEQRRWLNKIENESNDDNRISHHCPAALELLQRAA